MQKTMIIVVKKSGKRNKGPCTTQEYKIENFKIRENSLMLSNENERITLSENFYNV